MLAASSVVDPLLTSPQRARQHNADMAALHRMLPPLQLPPSSYHTDTTSSCRDQPYADTTSCREDAVESHHQDNNDDSDNYHSDNNSVEDEEEDAELEFDQQMNRGNHLRQLRMLALADEQERQASQLIDERCSENRNAFNDVNAGTFCEEKKEDFDDNDHAAHRLNDTSKSSRKQESSSSLESLQDEVRILPSTKEKVLNYESYLAHQRYYDDLKHVDIKYMDYGNVIVEQRKQLGKGGFCWDAGYILGEHVISQQHEWNNKSNQNQTTTRPPRVVELGAGTGLSGMMIAKATKSDVTITDLPELAGLMHDNIQRNFGKDDKVCECSSTIDNDDTTDSTMITTQNGKAKGTITSRILRWGIESDYEGAPYDVIIGADIVTSLYDPVALAQTLHALSGPSTKIYLSLKARLDKPHEEFREEVRSLFERVEKVERVESRLRNPDVFLIVAEGKKC